MSFELEPLVKVPPSHLGARCWDCNQWDSAELTDNLGGNDVFIFNMCPIPMRNFLVFFSIFFCLILYDLVLTFPSYRPCEFPKCAELFWKIF